MDPVSTLLGLCATQAFDVAKDVVGDFVADDIENFAKSLKHRLTTDLALPQTHELLRQVRTAELVAARHVATAYRQRFKYLPAQEKTNEHLTFAVRQNNFSTQRLTQTPKVA